MDNPESRSFNLQQTCASRCEEKVSAYCRDNSDFVYQLFSTCRRGMCEKPTHPRQETQTSETLWRTLFGTRTWRDMSQDPLREPSFIDLCVLAHRRSCLRQQSRTTFKVFTLPSPIWSLIRSSPLCMISIKLRRSKSELCRTCPKQPPSIHWLVTSSQWRIMMTHQIRRHSMRCSSTAMSAFSPRAIPFKPRSSQEQPLQPTQGRSLHMLTWATCGSMLLPLLFSIMGLNSVWLRQLLHILGLCSEHTRSGADQHVDQSGFL